MSDKDPCINHSMTVQVVSRKPDIYKCPRCGWFIGWFKKKRQQSDDLGILKIALEALESTLDKQGEGEKK